MNKKSKKYVNSLDVAQNNIVEGKSKKGNLEDMELNSTKFPNLSSSIKLFTGGLADEYKSGKKKQSKWQKSEHRETIKRSHNNSICDEEEPSTRKKRKKVVNVDAEYKPGMLSDFLQKQKFGCLILPWETSFGIGQPRLLSEEDVTGQKPKIKINPLFDTSKRNEGNIASKSCTTYTVFVGNLPQDVTVNRVKKIFKKFGNTISKIKIRSKENKNHKFVAGSNQNIGTKQRYKHAVVKFSSLESYKAALKMNGKLLNGHHLRITGVEGKTTSNPEKSVFVGNLAVGISDDVLWKTFENCGEIDSVRVIRDKLNKKGNFGYVNFQSTESVGEALELDGTSVLDREIRVSRINKNIDSLSNSITVKRNKKKQTKPELNASNNTVQSIGISNTFEEKQKKSQELSKHKPARDLEQQIEPEISVKKKKKKKKKKNKPVNVTEENISFGTE